MVPDESQRVLLPFRPEGRVRQEKGRAANRIGIQVEDS